MTETVTRELEDFPLMDSEADQARVDAAATQAARREAARIVAERGILESAHLLRGKVLEIDTEAPRDDKGKPLPFQAGRALAVTDCPDCTRGLQAASTSPLVLICSRLAGLGVPEKLLEKANDLDIIACGLPR